MRTATVRSEPLSEHSGEEAAEKESCGGLVIVIGRI